MNVAPAASQPYSLPGRVDDYNSAISRCQALFTTARFIPESARKSLQKTIQLLQQLKPYYDCREAYQVSSDVLTFLDRAEKSKTVYANDLEPEFGRRHVIGDLQDDLEFLSSQPPQAPALPTVVSNIVTAAQTITSPPVVSAPAPVSTPQYTSYVLASNVQAPQAPIQPAASVVPYAFAAQAMPSVPSTSASISNPAGYTPYQYPAYFSQIENLIPQGERERWQSFQQFCADAASSASQSRARPTRARVSEDWMSSSFFSSASSAAAAQPFAQTGQYTPPSHQGTAWSARLF